jgi:membrane associated rhomboid family serine protease
MHVIFNMFILYIFGPSVERERGSGWFIKFYLICGIAANLISFAARFAFGHGDVSGAGASGAVLGIVTACLMIYHNQMFYILWVFPVRALYIYYFLLILEAVWIIAPVRDEVDHYAHLGGLIVAWLLLRMKWPGYGSGGGVRKPRKPKKPKLATPKRGNGDGPRDFLEV